MEFINNSNAIFDPIELEYAILKLDPNPRETYTISKNTSNYAKICIAGKSWHLHRLISEAFNGPSAEVHHDDENPANNLLSNLIPCTHEEHLALHNRKASGIEISEYANNNEYMKEYMAQYRKKNRDKYNEYHKTYCRKYREKNHEAYKAYMRQYMQEHKKKEQQK